ncbi:MAG: hypothetical protein JNK66_08085 [Chitinophagales bacterium]|nr:hypothetical protein [Chitinophagales bacterium]
MGKLLSVILLMVIVPQVSCYAQSDNYRAQGKYYAAKEQYESANYLAALQNVYEAKQLLGGGTNYHLQYLHILSAYAGKKYIEAQQELAVYFDLVDGKLKPIFFQRSVEALTNDEVTVLTKLIDQIDKAAYREDNKCAKCNGTGELKKACDFESPDANKYRMSCFGNGKYGTVCNVCYGTPYKKSNGCYQCNSTGTVYRTCPKCSGSGRLISKCDACDGKGVKP